MPLSTRRIFRDVLKPGAAMLLPGVANALAARIVADQGFDAAYVTGAGIANTYLGIPDNGLVTLSELVGHVATIRDVFPKPLMVDADTGFGNALNMRRTIQVLERAGAFQRPDAAQQHGAVDEVVQQPPGEDRPASSHSV